MAQQSLKNKDFDLISVIYNEAQAVETCQQYIQDAEREGDSDAKQFFAEVQQTSQNLVNKGKQLLKSRL